MRKLQCTNCRQIFWMDLQIQESQVGRGEWVQNPCPRCGAEWAIVEPAAGQAAGRRGRKAKPGPKPQARSRKTAPKKEGTSAAFSSSAVRKLRKKLGVSQKKLASLVGVSTGTVVAWEAGKFSPRKNKVEELSDLEKWEKEDIKNLEPEKQAKPVEEKSGEAPPVKAKGKAKTQPGPKKKAPRRKKA
jgi:DNA-binding transcriptional regulator YiaG